MNDAGRALVVALLLAGCGGATHAGQDDGAMQPSGDGPLADGAMASDGGMAGDGAQPIDGGVTGSSAGCNTTPAHPTSYTASTTDGNGTARTYDVLVPSPYDGTKPLAVTFVFHGSGESSGSAMGYGVQTGAGATDASLFVFPSGIDFMGTGTGWDVFCAGYDMPFFDHMLAELEAQYCVDRSRVFSSGFSDGCDMSTGLTCCRGSEIRAIGAASCSDSFTSTTDYTSFKDYAKCPAPLHTGIRFTHDAAGGDAGYAMPLFTTTSQLYQHWLACTPSQSAPADVCTTYAGCDDPYIECPYTGLGHTRPPNWGPDTWSFFASFASQ